VTAQVEYTSYVDRKGYKIVPFKPALKPGTSILRSTGQSILDIPMRDIRPARIVRCGGERRALRLREYPMAYGEFANVKSHEELLEFITKYGSLTNGNEIGMLLDAAKGMKACLRSRKLPTWSIADLKASFSTDKVSGNATIKYSPATLLDALWLQVGQVISGGTEVRQCQHCGDWFSVGGEKGRRLVARFCKDEHRIAFNSLERTRKKRSR
jgi:hypothetical protein